jgi:hypothetical protein
MIQINKLPWFYWEFCGVATFSGWNNDKGYYRLQRYLSLFPYIYIKAIPLHAMEAHGGRGGIAPTHT